MKSPDIKIDHTKKKRKKKARITNRQAKISQKKKKPGKQTITRYKRLQQKVKDGFEQIGIPTESIEFVESPEGVKMSEVILKLADPLLRKFDDDDVHHQYPVAHADDFRQFG